MKSKLVKIAGIVATAPIIATGTAVLSVGKGLTHTGHALVKAGEATQASGARVREKGSTRAAGFAAASAKLEMQERIAKVERFKSKIEAELPLLSRLGAIEV
jgi:hypothetical protein